MQNVVDLAPDAIEASSTPRRFLYDADSGLTFFAATTPATGSELWVYDGAEARRVVDVDGDLFELTPLAVDVLPGALQLIT